MSPSKISPRLRRLVIERAKGVCEYCENQQELAIEEFEIDHIYPKALDGPTKLENLALACPPCNRRKSTKISGIDPETERRVRLFNPRQQDWNRHFKWSDDFGKVIGKTVCGRATIEALQMNRPRIVRIRRLWHSLELHPPTF